eukprot:scaffold72649_cov33-Cyclotella_meneghiniana.AAC.1
MEAVKNRVLWRGTACVTMRYIPSRDLVLTTSLKTRHRWHDARHATANLRHRWQKKQNNHVQFRPPTSSPATVQVRTG